MNVVTQAIPADHFTQQDRTAIPQLWIPAAELVAGVNRGKWIGAFCDEVPGNKLNTLVRLQPLRIKTQVIRQCMVDTNQTRFRYRYRQLARKKLLPQPGVAIIEWQ